MHVCIVCTPLPAPENGAVDQLSPVTAFSVATFTCDEGYDLEGSNRRLCRSSGQWTGSDTSCISTFKHMSYNNYSVNLLCQQ